jgi:uncharacterized protein YkwD
MIETAFANVFSQFQSNSLLSGKEFTMRMLLFIIPFIGIGINSFSQSVDFKRHLTAEQIKSANTGADATYMTEEERNILFWNNVARMYPKVFIKVVEEQVAYAYNNPSTLKNSSYYKSLMRDLNAHTPCEALQPSKTMFDLAYCFAREAGASGYVGHDRKKCKDDYMGECCAYTWANDGLHFVVQLMIDEGVPSLGHRKMMLDKKYKEMGTSIQPHKKYGFNAVLNFNY